MRTRCEEGLAIRTTRAMLPARMRALTAAMLSAVMVLFASTWLAGQAHAEVDNGLTTIAMQEESGPDATPTIDGVTYSIYEGSGSDPGSVLLT